MHKTITNDSYNMEHIKNLIDIHKHTFIKVVFDYGNKIQYFIPKALKCLICHETSQMYHNFLLIRTVNLSDITSDNCKNCILCSN